MLAKQYGDKFTLTNDPDEAARDADVLFTDVWVSMGMEREAEQRRRDFTGFTLDAARMALAKPDCMVQHPLPAHRGEEIAPDVLEAHADEIFDEAENRIYVEKAVLAVLLGGVFVGVGVGLIVRQGGSSGGDDALALVIHKLTGWRLSRAYLFTDLTVLFASLSYIPFRRIAFSLVTVTVSSLLIDFIQGNTA